MCDEDTVRENEAFFASAGGVTRRQFGKLAAGAALTMALPPVAHAAEVVGSAVDIETPDGVADCFLVHPASGKHPGVIIWPDILGLRPAFEMMGRRLAQSGYSVLVVNPFYRGAKAPVVPEGASFQDEAVRNIVYPLARALSAKTGATDAKAFVSFMDAHSSVDTGRKMGTTGYCMGGPLTMYAAAAVPGRIGAGASFHGGRLVRDSEDSPHLLVPKMKAQYLFAIAANDDERQPEAKRVLRKAFDDAGLAAEIEVYAGTMHGWCPPDSRVYDEAQAERAWSRLLALFEKALA